MSETMFKSYAELRSDIEEAERVATELREDQYRTQLVNKISIILDRMARQEKVEDFVEFPSQGPLADTKQEALQNKIFGEMKAALEGKGWSVVSPTAKGFGLKRK